ncbi:hypothetical protein JWV37_07755 [Sulfurospirillum sp. T05]|uniref:Uncharacterized protein n=1 Tax=Sulfurospirillum tamanense TaxID=2813362 RepID=A0ABS2WSS3_9BACT|nr:hypothetical protein [Sulfurospirillum tamanensis]MBN2964671.1 hypothetical protein [Sulfurospirillum tamanensis]
MNSSFSALLLALVFFELFEVLWQQGRSTRQYLTTLLRVYQRHILLFIALHPSFYFVLLCMMLFNAYTFAAWLLLGIKGVDIVIKLLFLDRLSQHKDLGPYGVLVWTDQPFPLILKLVPLAIYVVLFYLAFA